MSCYVMKTPSSRNDIDGGDANNIDPGSVANIVRRLFSAFLSRDRKALEALLADEFTFNSQKDNHIDKEEYFERCFPHSTLIRAHHIEQLFAEDNEALV